jgi:hypothetical protein
MTDQRENTPLTDDVKEMTIGGCRVRLAYCRAPDMRWSVKGTVICGIEDKAAQRTVVTKPFPNRDEAEQNAIQEVTALLGENRDRSHSRVRNWS